MGHRPLALIAQVVIQVPRLDSNICAKTGEGVYRGTGRNQRLVWGFRRHTQLAGQEEKREVAAFVRLKCIFW